MTQGSQSEIWLAAAQRGDRLALTKLLATYHPRLRARAVARMNAAMRAKSSPDDVLQEVYVQVVRQISQFEDRGPNSFLNWVCVILDHKVVDAQRAAYCQARDFDREVSLGARADASSYWDLLDHVRADSGTPSRVIRRQEALGALLACLSHLSEAHRQVIQMRFLEGLSVADVAAHLGKSEGAVVALSQRALQALRRSMNRMGEFTRGR